MLVFQNCTKDKYAPQSMNEDIYAILQKSFDERFFDYNYLTSLNFSVQEILDHKKITKGISSSLDINSLNQDQLYSPFMQKIRDYYKNNPHKRYYVQNNLGYPLWDNVTELSLDGNNLVFIPVAKPTSLFTEAILIIFQSKAEGKLRFHYVKRDKLDSYPILNDNGSNYKIPDRAYFIGLFLLYDKLVFNFTDCDLVKNYALAKSSDKTSTKGLSSMSMCTTDIIPTLSCYTVWWEVPDLHLSGSNEQCHWDYTFATTCQLIPSGGSGDVPPSGGGSGDTSTPPTPPPANARTRIPCPGDPISSPSIAPVCFTCSLSTGRFGAPRSSGLPHNGLDIQGLVGEPLFAQYPGIVIATDPFGTKCVDGIDGTTNGGKWVAINYYVNGVTMKFIYMHLNSISVYPGNTVGPGSIFGTIGATGNAANVDVKHVHIIVTYKYPNGTYSSPINPEDYLTTKFSTSGVPIPCTPLLIEN